MITLTHNLKVNNEVNYSSNIEMSQYILRRSYSRVIAMEESEGNEQASQEYKGGVIRL
ncbi:hypothetical protein KSX_50010 [Ktedonospora formicarum]|uniref:Uncharacterized protein n=1 Tax=Ktedonospora formicarum TaxID=2778364 RepID=A0A8J3I4G7_9CHLR|nr:hypothetical protein KSX_50010 [Ktedonospora formicarum]